MTGTETKHRDKQSIYERLCLDILVNISINDAVDMDILSNYTINVLMVDLDTRKNLLAGNKNKRFYTSEKANYEYLNRQAEEAILTYDSRAKFKIMNRLKAIKTSISKESATKDLLSKLKGRILIFAGSINQAENLCEYTYHSKTDNINYDKFKAGEIDRIAMVNAGGIGHTYKEIDHLILVQADSDKNGLTSQKICRTLLKQKDYKATVWIICLKGTKDIEWINKTLSSFNKSNINYIEYKNN